MYKLQAICYFGRRRVIKFNNEVYFQLTKLSIFELIIVFILNMNIKKTVMINFLLSIKRNNKNFFIIYIIPKETYIKFATNFNY